MLGITLQQVQKYESGTNRVPSSRLKEIAKILKVSMDFFFADELLKKIELFIETNGIKTKKDERDIVDLINSFSSINDTELKECILKLLKISQKY